MAEEFTRLGQVDHKDPVAPIDCAKTVLIVQRRELVNPKGNLYLQIDHRRNQSAQSSSLVEMCVHDQSVEKVEPRHLAAIVIVLQPRASVTSIAQTAASNVPVRDILLRESYGVREIQNPKGRPLTEGSLGSNRSPSRHSNIDEFSSQHSLANDFENGSGRSIVIEPATSMTRLVSPVEVYHICL